METHTETKAVRAPDVGSDDQTRIQMSPGARVCHLGFHELPAGLEDRQGWRAPSEGPHWLRRYLARRKRLQLWDLKTFQSTYTVETPDLSITVVFSSPDGKLLTALSSTYGGMVGDRIRL